MHKRLDPSPFVSFLLFRMPESKMIDRVVPFARRFSDSYEDFHSSVALPGTDDF